MLYRILRSVNAAFALVVVCICIVACVLALALMFSFPPGALLLVFLGLAGLGVAVAASKALRAMQRAVARSSLRGGTCPRCGQRDTRLREFADKIQCMNCETEYAADGSEISHDVNYISVGHGASPPPEP